MIQFVYTKGSYREFRGYPFINGKPTTVTDRATVEALDMDKEFERFYPAKSNPPVYRRPVLSLRRKSQ